LEPLTSDKDIEELKTMIRNHEQQTDSSVAQHILDNWEAELKHFVKVIPDDYKRVLMETAAQETVFEHADAR
jgi:glutamate synthase domain-containing protein 3